MHEMICWQYILLWDEVDLKKIKPFSSVLLENYVFFLFSEDFLHSWGNVKLNCELPQTASETIKKNSGRNEKSSNIYGNVKMKLKVG